MDQNGAKKVCRSVQTNIVNNKVKLHLCKGLVYITPSRTVLAINSASVVHLPPHPRINSLVHHCFHFQVSNLLPSLTALEVLFHEYNLILQEHIITEYYLCTGNVLEKKAVDTAVKIKCEKVVRLHVVTVDVIKKGGKSVNKMLVSLCNICYQARNASADWMKTYIVPI